MNYADIHIPDHAHEALEQYFQFGFAPGSFCTAVLANDLFSAAAKADHWNRTYLADIARWVQHNAPYGSWGSYEKIQGWLDKNEHYQNYQKSLTFNILKDTV
jgi:hypothetical protein